MEIGSRSKDLIHIKYDWVFIYSYINAFISKYDKPSNLQTSWTNKKLRNFSIVKTVLYNQNSVHHKTYKE
jgi:hypothetical protein